jgi:hypothetical protein
VPTRRTPRSPHPRRPARPRVGPPRVGPGGWTALARLAAAGLTAGTLLLPALAAAAVPATTAPAGGTTGATSDPAQAAAGYLARQLVGGTHLSFEGSTLPDAGMTADAVFSMAAAKVAGTAQAAATGWLAANSAGYIDAVGAFGGPSAGAYAKLALVAEVTGGDPHAFGGVDLLTNLSALECPAAGRPECAGQVGAFRSSSADAVINMVTQALAVIALTRSPVAADHPDAAAVDFLTGQQCPDGGFPVPIHAAGGACVSEVDGTAFAAQALVAAGRTEPAKAALDWLASVRQPNGSFANSGGPSANSTAVAVEALVAGGRDASASVAWLRSQQVGCAGPAVQRGAVRFAGAFDAKALRATSQAGMALAGQSFTTLTGAGSTPAGPLLACAAAPTPTPSPTPVTTTPPPAAAPPPPVLAETNALDGRAVTLLGALGAALLAAGAAALLLARRRA